MNNIKKDYVFSVGGHFDAEGKEYEKGDKIKLTEKEAQSLVNKVVDPEDFGVKSDEATQSDLKDAQAEIEELKAKLKAAESKTK